MSVSLLLVLDPLPLPEPLPEELEKDDPLDLPDPLPDELDDPDVNPEPVPLAGTRPRAGRGRARTGRLRRCFGNAAGGGLVRDVVVRPHALSRVDVGA